MKPYGVNTQSKYKSFWLWVGLLYNLQSSFFVEYKKNLFDFSIRLLIIIKIKQQKNGLEFINLHTWSNIGKGYYKYVTVIANFY